MNTTTKKSGYLGWQPDTGDHCKAEPGVRDRMCGAAARGAIGDCVRPKGHDGFHQGAWGYSFTDAFVARRSTYSRTDFDPVDGFPYPKG